MSATDEARSATVECEFDGDRTQIAVAGTHEAAVVVESAGDERIYLPPDREEIGQNTPYRPTESGGGAYEGLDDESPYGSSRRSDPGVGMTVTTDGFRIVHPDPVEDVRLLR